MREANRRKKTFSLTLEDFKNLISKDCEYCGRASADVCGMGIDCVVSSVGYELSNCVPCCAPCNFFKARMSCEKFLEQVFRIADYQRGGKYDSRPR